MDGLTTNGVLIMHPKGSFCGGNAKCGLWRETSLGGEVFSLRESRSAQQKGQPVSYCRNFSHSACPLNRLWLFIFTVLSRFSSHFQIKDENNVLQDGTLIDLCGATLLWRSHEGLTNSPVSLSPCSIIHER
jgi:pellino protein